MCILFIPGSYITRPSRGSFILGPFQTLSDFILSSSSDPRQLYPFGNTSPLFSFYTSVYTQTLLVFISPCTRLPFLAYIPLGLDLACLESPSSHFSSCKHTEEALSGETFVLLNFDQTIYFLTLLSLIVFTFIVSSSVATSPFRFCSYLQKLQFFVRLFNLKQ